MPPQTSAYGAFLDVVVDNASRALLWMDSVPARVAVFPVMLEGITFTCTHAVGTGSELGGGNRPCRLAEVMHATGHVATHASRLPSLPYITTLFSTLATVSEVQSVHRGIKLLVLVFAVR